MFTQQGRGVQKRRVDKKRREPAVGTTVLPVRERIRGLGREVPKVLVRSWGKEATLQRKVREGIWEI